MASTSIENKSTLSWRTWLIATGLGSGMSPFASGTAGSAVALVIWWAFCFLCDHIFSLESYLLVKTIVILSTFAIGIPAVNSLIQCYDDLDPKQVVIDEFVGMWITAFFLSTHNSAPVWLASFFLFRLFDVLKPPPASNAESLPGAYGVMMDDVIAGVMGLAVLCTLQHILVRS